MYIPRVGVRCTELCAHLGSAQGGGCQCAQRSGCAHMGYEARSANQPNLPLPNMQLRHIAYKTLDTYCNQLIAIGISYLWKEHDEHCILHVASPNALVHSASASAPKLFCSLVLVLLTSILSSMSASTDLLYFPVIFCIYPVLYSCAV